MQETNCYTVTVLHFRFLHVIPITLFLHVRVGAENGLCQSLRLVTEGIQVGAHLVIAEHDTHAATYVSLWLAKDADASAVFFQGIKHVVVERLGAFLWREDDGRATIVLQVDAGDRQAHHGTEVKLKLREVGGMTECHHTCIVWTRTQLGEDDLALFGQEELYAPKTSARQSLGHLAGDVLGLLQGCLWKLEWLPALTVVAALLYVSDRWAEEGRTVFLCDGEEREL